MLLLAISCQTHYVFGMSVRLWLCVYVSMSDHILKVLNVTSNKPLGTISPNLVAVRDTGKLITFWGQKVKFQCYDETWYGQKSLVQKCTFLVTADSSPSKISLLLTWAYTPGATSPPRGRTSPPQNLERGTVPQILSCCKMITVLALQCRKMCFLPLQQDFLW